MIVRELLTVLGFKVNNEGAKKYEDTFTKLKETAKKVVEILAVVEIGKKMLEAASQQEQTAMAFATALGSAEKASKFMEELTQFSMKTGFNKDELEKYSKQLLYMGFSTEKILPTMNMLGDIAVGVGKEKLPVLVDAIGKMQQKQKVDSRSFNALLSSGVPILEELRKQTGLNTEEIAKMGNEGTLRYEDMDRALRSLTGTGGKFNNLLMQQANTFQGVFSRIKIAIDELLEALGMEILPLVRDIGSAFLEFFGKNFEMIKNIGIKVISTLAFVLGYVFGIVNKVARAFGGWDNIIRIVSVAIDIVAEVVQAFFTGLAPLVPLILTIIAVIKVWSIVQMILNVILTANPIGLIIAGIGLLIVAVGLLIKNWSKVSAFFKKLWSGIVDTFKNAFKWIWGLLDNKWIQGLLAVFMPFIGIPILIIKNWDKIKSFFINLFLTITKTIKPFIDWISNVWAQIIKFFGGKFGNVNMNANQTIVPSTAKQPVTKNNTFQVKSDIQIGVPPGTSESQKQFIQQHVEATVQKSWQGIMRDTNANTGRVDWSGVTP